VGGYGKELHLGEPLAAPSASPGGSALAAPSLTSAALARAGFRHAFFTRQGGVGAPPWDTLSFAVSTGDDAGAVAENRARAASALGVEPGALYYLSQVHGVAHRVLRRGEAFEDVVRAVGDITVSADAGVACGIRTADCVPILLAHPGSRAVAAIHSGWRGTTLDVARAGVEALRAVAGPGRILAAVGPHIERCCFEVGDDVAAELARASSAAERAVLREPGRRAHVDLRRVVHAQLLAAGLAAADIDDVPGCTVCDSARFFSYRRDGARSGRLLSAIVAG
jgi:YfiH family protein